MQTAGISSHPYHVPPRRGPGRPRTTSSSPESNRWHDQAEKLIWDPPLPNFVLVPQDVYPGDTKAARLDPSTFRAPILFRYLNAGTNGVLVGSFLPEIIGKYDKVLDHGYREIKVRVQVCSRDLG